jgi:UDP-3-O-[3-hydroxymyristoyl] N-acetylglucosamine deacetylase/3-hydroxyacyl-[acyl-carrier-protein] dehydratase
MKQKTIKKECEVSGIGLHTGTKTRLRFKPAEVNAGLRFIRIDLPGAPVIKVEPESAISRVDIQRCTCIGSNGAMIYTVEHLMSVLCGLGITNLTMEIDGNEIPGLDGSGRDFLAVLKNAGVFEQDAQAQIIKILEPIGVYHNGKSIYIVPADEFKISYVLDYPYPLMQSQFFSITFNQESFEKDIASCRTFCLESEAEELKKLGLGKGANYDNTLVVSEKGVKNNQLRFPNEFARHKILDIIGDLYLLGKPIQGHVFAVKSGHGLNMLALRKIAEQYNISRGTIQNAPLKVDAMMTINDIMKILPHRYPFLLVDRIIELEKGKRAVGIKNVTINDSFFEGHFPTRPVMPGVLIVEAMAQTAGLAVLTNKEHHGKVAFFMAADKVKFRRVVVPGDQLVMETEVIRDRSKTAHIRAVAKVEGEVAAEADMVFSFTNVEYLYE